MRCSAARKALVQFAGEGAQAALPSVVAEHLQTCPQCAAEHTALLVANQMLAHVAAPAPDDAFFANLHQRVMTEVGTEQSARRWVAWNPWRWVGATAVAATALAIGVWSLPHRAGLDYREASAPSVADSGSALSVDAQQSISLADNSASEGVSVAPVGQPSSASPKSSMAAETRQVATPIASRSAAAPANLPRTRNRNAGALRTALRASSRDVSRRATSRVRTGFQPSAPAPVRIAARGVAQPAARSAVGPASPPIVVAAAPALIADTAPSATPMLFDGMPGAGMAADLGGGAAPVASLPGDRRAAAPPNAESMAPEESGRFAASAEKGATAPYLSERERARVTVRSSSAAPVVSEASGQLRPAVAFVDTGAVIGRPGASRP